MLLKVTAPTEESLTTAEKRDGIEERPFLYSVIFALAVAQLFTIPLFRCRYNRRRRLALAKVDFTPVAPEGIAARRRRRLALAKAAFAPGAEFTASVKADAPEAQTSTKTVNGMRLSGVSHVRLSSGSHWTHRASSLTTS